MKTLALVNMRSLLQAAEEGGYAVGSFSAANMECIRGIIRAAERCRSPVILQVAEIRLPYSPLPLIGPMMLAAAREASVPVAVHLDHGKSVEVIRQALERGSASAAMLVASHACSRDMPTEDALEAFIEKEKAQYGSVISAL